MGERRGVGSVHRRRGLTYERVERQLERYYKALYRRYPGTLDRGIEVAVVTSTLYAFMIVMGLE